MNWVQTARRFFGLTPRDTAYSGFNTIAFLDTNIILEGKQLKELPWGELDPIGPILVLPTPEVLSEV